MVLQLRRGLLLLLAAFDSTEETLMERLTRRDGGASSFYQESPIETEVQGITSFPISRHFGTAKPLERVLMREAV